MKKLLRILMMALMVFACERRPLEDPEYNTDINIAVDIKAICNVTCDIYNEKIPIPPIETNVMRALFYHPTEDVLIADTFVSEHGVNAAGEPYIGGSVSIVPGTYRILIYSFGTESTLINNFDSFDNAIAFTDPLSEAKLKSLALKSGVEEEHQPILYQPDHLIVARSFEEVIPYHQGLYTIHAKASSIVETYYLQIKVDGLEYVSSAQAILKGMNPSKVLINEQMDEENPSALYIPLVKSTDNGAPVVCNIFNTFGRLPINEGELMVTFDLTTHDGRRIQQSFDIADLFESEDCILHHWLLLEKHIKVDPAPDSSSGGGFDPAVEDWDREYRDVNI